MAERPVAVTDAATATARAFDAVADEYDRANSDNPLLSHMRAEVMRTLRRHVPAGAEVIDLGCGPGTDHDAMLAAGYRVTGIDVSPEMTRHARERALTRNRMDQPSILCMSIDQVSSLPAASFDAAFSNFGPLNCVADLALVAGQLRTLLRPGGVLVASVIGRVCPWEIALYLRRGEVRRAFTRFRTGPVGVPLRTGTVWTRYWTPRAFRRVFIEAGFVRREQRCLGLAAPPPYMEAFAVRNAAWVVRLQRLDDAIGGWPVVRTMGDHFLIVLQRS
jgi:SAM-dependent methyltransferase